VLDRLLTVEEAAERLGTSVRFVRPDPGPSPTRGLVCPVASGDSGASSQH
jgi:hypothetical protein